MTIAYKKQRDRLILRSSAWCFQLLAPQLHRQHGVRSFAVLLTGSSDGSRRSYGAQLLPSRRRLASTQLGVDLFRTNVNLVGRDSRARGVIYTCNVADAGVLLAMLMDGTNWPASTSDSRPGAPAGKRRIHGCTGQWKRRRVIVQTCAHSWHLRLHVACILRLTHVMIETAVRQLHEKRSHHIVLGVTMLVVGLSEIVYTATCAAWNVGIRRHVNRPIEGMALNPQNVYFFRRHHCSADPEQI